VRTPLYFYERGTSFTKVGNMCSIRCQE